MSSTMSINNCDVEEYGGTLINFFVQRTLLIQAHYIHNLIDHNDHLDCNDGTKLQRCHNPISTYYVYIHAYI